MQQQLVIGHTKGYVAKVSHWLYQRVCSNHLSLVTPTSMQQPSVTGQYPTRLAGQQGLAVGQHREEALHKAKRLPAAC